MNRLINWFCRFIPMHFSNRMLLRCLQLMRRIQRNGKMLSLSHDMQNSAVVIKDGYIEAQNELTNMHLGMATMQAAGCEVIATYNAIRALATSNTVWDGIGKLTGFIPLHLLISAYERDGIMLSGKFGVAPKAIVDMLNKLGFKTSTLIPGKKKYDMASFVETARAIIMTYYNDGTDLNQEIHTVAVTKDERGLIAHNVYCNGYVHGPFDNIEELIGTIGKGRAKPIMFISIL